MKNVITVLALCLSTSAMAGQTSIFEAPTDRAGDDLSISLNQFLTQNYYDQFLFKMTGDCKDINSVWFHSFATYGETVIGQDPKGRDIIVGIKLNLFENGSYWGVYREVAVIERTDQYTRVEPLFEKTLTGSWHTEGDKFIADTIGTGLPLIEEKKQKVSFKFLSSFNDKRVIGINTVMGRIGTNVGPHGESINEYCKNN